MAVGRGQVVAGRHTAVIVVVGERLRGGGRGGGQVGGIEIVAQLAFQHQLAAVIVPAQPLQPVGSRLGLVGLHHLERVPGSGILDNLPAEAGELQVGVGILRSNASGGQVGHHFIRDWRKVEVGVVIAGFPVAYSLATVARLVVAHIEVGVVDGGRVSQLPILGVVVLQIEGCSQRGIVGQVHTSAVCYGHASGVGGTVEQVEAVLVLQLDSALLVFCHLPHVGRVGRCGFGHLQLRVVQTAIGHVIAQYVVFGDQIDCVPMTRQRTACRSGYSGCQVEGRVARIGIALHQGGTVVTQGLSVGCGQVVACLGSVIGALAFCQHGRLVFVGGDSPARRAVQLQVIPVVAFVDVAASCCGYFPPLVAFVFSLAACDSSHFQGG